MEKLIISVNILCLFFLKRYIQKKKKKKTLEGVGKTDNFSKYSLLIVSQEIYTKEN